MCKATKIHTNSKNLSLIDKGTGKNMISYGGRRSPIRSQTVKIIFKKRTVCNLVAYIKLRQVSHLSNLIIFQSVLYFAIKVL